MERDCCKFICGAPTTFQGYGIEWNRREVTKLACIVVCVYISILTQFAYYLSLFEPVNLLSKPSNAFKA